MNNEQSKILVTGGSGLLGRAVCRLFNQKGIAHTVTTHNRRILTENMVFMDLATGERVSEAVKAKP